MNEKEVRIKIENEFLKLDSLLKLAGTAPTGGQAKILIKDGKVSVNGKTCLERGRKIYPGTQVYADGLKIITEAK